MDAVRAVTAGSLVDRALAHLAQGPRDSLSIAREVLGLPSASSLIAERLSVALLGADARIARLEDGRWEVLSGGGGSPPLEACSFAVVDVETTGSRAAGGDRVIEVAVVLVRGGIVELVYEALVNPGCPIPASVSSLTGITAAMVRDRPPFSALADEILTALSGRVFVAHNAPFDWAFLYHELRRSKDRVLQGARVCTVRLARRLVPELKSRGLDSVARFFGIPIQRRHRAAGDAVATAQVLLRLLEIAQAKGAATVADLATVGRRPRTRRTALPGPAEDIWPW